jgi:hypothetical protein
MVMASDARGTNSPHAAADRPASVNYFFRHQSLSSGGARGASEGAGGRWRRPCSLVFTACAALAMDTHQTDRPTDRDKHKQTTPQASSTISLPSHFQASASFQDAGVSLTACPGRQAGDAEMRYMLPVEGGKLASGLYIHTPHINRLTALNSHSKQHQSSRSMA